MTLTDPEFVKRLETLYLLARKVLAGSLSAERRTKKKGSGILFSDYSEYNQGDDYRSIDWKIYSRMEQLVVKLFEVEEDLTVFILLDMSISMGPKMEFAKKLAAAIGYIALNSLDKVGVYGVSDSLKRIYGVSRGRGASMPFLSALERAECYGEDTRFSESLKSFYARHKRPSICVLISDFFTPHGYADGLNFLRWAKNDIYCLQVMDPAEMKCDWKGDVEIECVETKQRKKITVSPHEVHLYENAVKKWNDDLEAHCSKSAIGFTRATNDVPFEHVIESLLRRGGLVS